MQWLPVMISMLIIVQYNAAKETVVYQATGVELIDLIRGYKTKDNVLNLKKVEGDRTNLPDGIYFEPEDEVLTGETQHLHFNGQEKKSRFGKKTGNSHDEQLTVLGAFGNQSQ